MKRENILRSVAQNMPHYCTVPFLLSPLVTSSLRLRSLFNVPTFFPKKAQSLSNVIPVGTPSRPFFNFSKNNSRLSLERKHVDDRDGSEEIRRIPPGPFLVLCALRCKATGIHTVGVVETSVWGVHRNDFAEYRDYMRALERNVEATFNSCGSANEAERVLIPAHVNQEHWVLAVLNLKLKQVIVYDSLQKFRMLQPLDVSHGTQFAEQLKEVASFVLQQRRPEMMPSTPEEIAAYALPCNSQLLQDITDDYNCGVHVVYNANLYLSRAPEIDRKPLIITRLTHPNITDVKAFIDKKREMYLAWIMRQRSSYMQTVPQPRCFFKFEKTRKPNIYCFPLRTTTDGS
uniref:ULP_PROTEASE domain-containing protein n=1 Tax=Steinernema glaseri TaxID=37863 RepID=A0A1I7YA12_9BILA